MDSTALANASSYKPLSMIASSILYDYLVPYLTLAKLFFELRIVITKFAELSAHLCDRINVVLLE